jgi:hypothetical protein
MRVGVASRRHRFYALLATWSVDRLRFWPTICLLKRSLTFYANRLFCNKTLQIPINIENLAAI